MDYYVRKALIRDVLERHRDKKDITTYEAIQQIFLVFPEYTESERQKYCCEECYREFTEEERIQTVNEDEYVIKLFWSMTPSNFRDATQRGLVLCPFCKQLSGKKINNLGYL